MWADLAKSVAGGLAKGAAQGITSGMGSGGGNSGGGSSFTVPNLMGDNTKYNSGNNNGKGETKKAQSSKERGDVLDFDKEGADVKKLIQEWEKVFEKKDDE